MYDVDSRFFNDDGSVKVEMALAAGRRDRIRAAREVYQGARAVIARLFRLTPQPRSV